MGKAQLVGLFWCVAWAGCGERRDQQRTAPLHVAHVDAARAPAQAPAPDVGGVRPDTGAPDLSPLQQPLEAEAREPDPASARVRLKLFVQPVEAEVFWGRKRLGVAGRQPLTLERPRGSGPLEVVVRAPGFLPFHTRLFGDRDDSLSVRLVTPLQARGLLGYRPKTDTAPPPAPR